ncbi:MAG TPA: DedA family protein [Candidatus Saccharimonadales bacterium]|nr:DedA family protein [Candidatus Saccharimonadales bacterium]
MPDVAHIIHSGGLALIALIIFAESGMFVGFFLPGDTLLLSAGVFAAKGQLSLASVILVVALAAIAGDNVGYRIGKFFEHRLFEREDGVLFKREHVEKAEKFFERYGSRTMLLAHFVPIVRTFAPPLAGIAEMPFHQFFIFDAIGDTAWAASVTLIGFWFGSRIPNLDHYILLVVAGVMVFSLGPAIYQFIKIKRQRRRSKKS